MRKTFFVLAVLAAAIAATTATMASATAPLEPQVGEVAWNPQDKPRCGTGTAWSIKIDPVVSGTYGGKIVITVKGSSFDWALTQSALHAYDMAAILVKGGPSTVRVYTYSSAYSDSGTGLTAAINPNNGKPYGLSHITVCLDPKAP